MRHAVTRDLFNYWHQRRGEHEVPDSLAFDPFAIPRLLGNTVLVEIDGGRGHPFRLAGSMVCALFHRELRGVPFLDVWDGTDRLEMERLISAVGEEACVAVVAADGRSSRAEAMSIEWILLPLAHRGSTRTRLIGACSADSAPYWSAIRPLSALSLVSIQFPDRDRRASTLRAAPAWAPQIRRAVAGARRVGHLAVIEGGRAARR